MTNTMPEDDSPKPSPDAFQSGALITDQNRKVVYANAYFTDELNWKLDILIGKSSDDLFTYSSKIFCESYLMPLLLHEKKCEEMQLALLDGNGTRVPVIISAKMNQQGHIYWSFFNASKRDRLYEELIDVRKKLESQAKLLESMSSTDELTGLMNRREMNKRTAIIIKQANRFKHSLAVLLVDIDHFKNINDSFGHLEGDRVLKELGLHLQTFGRETDLIARFGGEEFLLMLPDTNIDDAKVFAQKLHSLVSSVTVNGLPITISIGITMGSQDADLQTLTLQADQALYAAKEGGRNKTVIFEQDN